MLGTGFVYADSVDCGNNGEKKVERDFSIFLHLWVVQTQRLDYVGNIVHLDIKPLTRWYGEISRIESW